MKNARTYTVFWHYVGNHGAYVREAPSPEEACRSVIRGFGDEFAAKAELVAVEGAHRMRKAADWMAPTVDSVLKSKMGHLIDEAVEYVTKRMTASLPFYKTTSDRYRERLDDEWQNNPAVPEALRDVDTDDVWNYFIDIVVALAEGELVARRGRAQDAAR